MKTAVKHMMLGSCLLALSFVVSPAATHAQSASQGMPTVASANAAATSPVMPPAMNMPAQEIKIPNLPTPFSGEGKGMSSGGNKIPDSVKDVIKRLNAKTEDVTLDDLNNAREAVAKLDALIDIEKRLVDLDKIRMEREKADRSSMMAAAIPASALTPPPSYLPTPMPPVSLPAPINNTTPPMATKSMMAPPIIPSPAVDVLQIEGSNNRYVALIKEGDTTHLVHAGDHLSDDSVVLSVSKRGVELQRSNKIARLIEVKDVQSVFGSTP